MADPVPLRAKPCPICAKPSTSAAAPFCSTACRNEDLRRWLGGEYRVPSEDPIGPAPEGDDPDR
jgi:endogenous inhibitor of DNA gyrase (YacG/DUF329 family)